jgi:copper chaperone CopZ
MHCVMHVKKALSDIDGVEVESVDIGKAKIWTPDEPAPEKAVAAALEEAGYKLVSIQ